MSDRAWDGRVNIPGVTLEDELGRGASSIVYRASRNGTPCAVKIGTDGKTSRWFRREAAALARVCERGLPTVIEVGEVRSVPYLVMELVEGETLADRLRRRMGVREVLALAIGLARVLDAVHRRGLVHRDVKPVNIVVAADGTVRLVDFGFATFSHTPRDAAGTRRYAAPEQLRVPVMVDGRTDLYALGCVLRECLTASSERAPNELARRLDEIVDGLVQREPAKRYQTAGALLADFERVKKGDAPHGPSLSIRQPLEALAFVGRGQERLRLSLAWSDSENGWGGAHVLRGPRGAGKSRLISEVLGDVGARVGEAHTLMIRCEEADPRPFAALRKVLAAVASSLDGLTPEERQAVSTRMRRAVGDELAPFATLLSPALAALLGATTSPSRDVGGDTFSELVGELLARLVRDRAPILLMVDDAQWLDAASADVFARLAQRASALPLLLLVAARNDGASSALTRFERTLGDELNAIDLETFSELAATQLIGSFLGQAPPDGLAVWIANVADGTPLGVLEVLDAMIESGALEPFEGAWRLDPECADRIHLPHGALRLLERRLRDLPSATRRVLEAAAVLGASFDDDVVAEVVGVDPKDLGFATAEARRAGMIASDGVARHRFVHDTVRDALQAAPSASQIRALHQRVAETLERRGTADPYVLATHYLSGEAERNRGRVLEVAGEAIRRALDAFDNDAALRFTEHVRSVLGLTGETFDRELAKNAGEAALRLGSHAESVSFFEMALARTADKLERAAILGRVAWAHQMRPDSDKAWEALQRAFDEIGAPMPIESPSTAFHTVVTLGRAFFSSAGVETPPAAVDLLCNLHYQNARLGLEYGRPLRLLQSTLQARQLAALSGPSSTLAKTEALYGAVMTILGRRETGTAHIEIGRRMAAEVGSPAVAAYCTQLSAVAAMYGADFDGALDFLRRLLDEQGHWLETYEFYINVYNTYLIESLRGRPREAWAWLVRAHDRAARGGRNSAGFELVAYPTRATWISLHPEVDERAIAKALRVPFDFGGPIHGVVRTCVWGARARCLVERGDCGPELDGLIAEFQRDEKGKGHAVLADYYLAVVQARIHQAIRAGADERASLSPKLAAALADLRASAKLPILRAHVSAGEAFYAWLGGNDKKASRKLIEAEELADRETCPRVLYDVARARAHMLRASGKHDASQQRARLAADIARHQGAVHWERWIREEFGLQAARATSSSYALALSGRSVSASSSRRQLGALLHMLQVSSAAIDGERLSQLLIDELLQSMNADRGVLWCEADGRSAPSQAVGRTRNGEVWRDVPQASRGLMDRARASGTLQLGEEVRSAPRAVAMPLWLREQVIGVAYVERDPARAPFDDEDMETLQALSYQVPMTLELARALKDRQRLEEVLRQAQKMEAIGRFAGGIAHDFNNMLTVMMASIDAMRDRESLWGEMKDDVDLMHEAVTRATTLTRQLLTFARRQSREVAVHDLNGVIADLQPMIQRLIGDHIAVRLLRCEGAARIAVDRNMLEQAVVNLASNARDAMPRGGQLDLEIVRMELDEAATQTLLGMTPGNAVRLVVRDNGVGMARETRDAAFDPFFTTKEHGQGTGLGLSMVYGFVHHSQGAIQLESELGRGTEFRIYFPEAAVAQPEAPKVLRAVPSNGASAKAPARAKPATILVVDDEHQVRSVLERVLVRYGYRVVASAHPREALRLAGELGQELDLLITDVLMPEMTGPDLAEAVLELAPRAKLLFMSGYTDGDLEGVLSRRQAPFLQKPFQPEVMRALVDRLLKDESNGGGS